MTQMTGNSYQDTWISSDMTWQVIFKNPYGKSSSYLFNKDVLAFTQYTSNVKADTCPFSSKHRQKHSSGRDGGRFAQKREAHVYKGVYWLVKEEKNPIQHALNTHN